MKKRDNAIDIIRGLAIFSMIAANMAPHSLIEPHSFCFRLYGSFAAPTFIFLSGMMISYSESIKKRDDHYLKRAVLVIMCGVLIDYLLWRIFPFATFDVLYLIGFCLLITPIFLKIKKKLQFLLVSAIFLFTPLLQFKIGYNLILNEPQTINDFQYQSAIRQFLLDGWFPIFPWMGVFFLGTFYGRIRVNKDIQLANKYFVLSGSLLMSIGIISWIVIDPYLTIREGYGELFYPTTLIYLSSYIGFILILFPLIEMLSRWKFVNIFSVFGRSSLLAYILHTIFIVFIFNKFFAPVAFTTFILFYLFHSITIWLIFFFIEKFDLKRKIKLN